MNSKHTNNINVLVGLTWCLGACGGGSSSSSAPESQPLANTTPTPTAAVIVVKSGVISGFGSVYIDGQRYQTDSSTVLINGVAQQGIGSLKVGMNVSLASRPAGDNDLHEAFEIHYSNDVEGVITAIDRNNHQLQLVGTTVTYNDLTHFIGSTTLSLKVGDRVEVSGYLNTNSEFIATYIELDDYLDNDAHEYTRGIVSAHDAANRSFRLNGILADYNGAIVTGQIADGKLVKVSGTLSNGELAAHEVQILRHRFNGEIDEGSISHYEIEGLITSYDVAAKLLSVDGVAYTLAGNLQVSGNAPIQVSTFAEIYINPTTDEIYRIELKGDHLRSDGRVKGRISAIDTLNKSLTVNGRAYSFSATTRFESDSNQFIGFNSLNVNDAVEIVFIEKAGSLQIQRIERETEEEYSQLWELKGIPQNYNAQLQTVSLNGIIVALRNDARYLDSDRLVDRNAFLDALSNPQSRKMEIEGFFDQGQNFIATKIELYPAGYDADHYSGDDDSFGSDNDQNGIGYVEIEGRISAPPTNNSFVLNGHEVRLDNATHTEIDDIRVSVADFMSRVTTVSNIEIEGYWVNATHVYAIEAEIETNDND